MYAVTLFITNFKIIFFQVEASVETVDDVSYMTPTIPPEYSSSVYLAEHFDDPTNFKRRWIKSKTKKEGIDEDIAKYDGIVYPFKLIDFVNL